MIHRALLIEDNPAFEQLVCRAIARLGPEWEVKCCRTGGSALRVFADAKSRFDLVLADLGLPDISGIDVIRAARLRYPEIPIMVVSVIAAEESVLAAIQAGARGYLLKDQAEAPMAQAIGEVLAGNYPISPALARYLFKLAGAPGSRPEGNRIKLSPKELELLKLLARGQTYAEAADRLEVTLSTVQTHVRNMYRKLDAQSKGEAISRARDHGLI